MRKYILIFVLVAFASVSASVVTSKIVSTPAIPKQIFVKEYRFAEDSIADVKSLSSKGWIVKHFSVAYRGNHGYQTSYLIMEKY